MLKSITRLLGVTILGAAAFAAAPASAATLGVSATVADSCVLSTSPVAFGNIDTTSSTDTDAAGGISVTCTSGTAWSASADAGLGTSATLSVRQMASAGNLLNYALYTDSTHTSIWGDGTSGTTLISDTGTGSAQSKTVYGRVPGAQSSVPVGDYADTVNVTITY